MTSDFRFPDHPGKDPAESAPVVLDWFRLCANYWRANEQRSASEFIRPNVATGFSYECMVAGTSGAREPRWPTTIGATIVEGSVTWACRAADANGLNAITGSPTVTIDPPGNLTAGAVSLSESTKVLATYAGGFDGQDYDAVCMVTINGVTRVGRQRVPVRRR